MGTANLGSSDGWKFMMPSDSQRRARLTTGPTCGISTATSRTRDTRKSLRAMRSQVAMDTWKASSAPTKAMPMDMAWRIRKWVGAILPKRGLSGMAIDAEYTMTRLQASRPMTTQIAAWARPSALAGVAADQHGRAHMARHGRDQRREILALAVATQDDHDAVVRAQAGQRGHGGAHVRALAVVVVLHAVDAANGLDAVRLAPVLTQ